MRNGIVLAVLSLFVALAAPAALAQDEDSNPSLDRILPRIRERHPGKFYDAEGPWRMPDGQLRYRLKWMTPDGRIVWFDADARTGRVLGPDSAAHGEERFGPRLRDDERVFHDNERRYNRGARWPEKDPRPRRGGR